MGYLFSSAPVWHRLFYCVPHWSNSCYVYSEHQCILAIQQYNGWSLQVWEQLPTLCEIDVRWWQTIKERDLSYSKNTQRVRWILPWKHCLEWWEIDLGINQCLQHTITNPQKLTDIIEIYRKYKKMQTISNHSIPQSQWNETTRIRLLLKPRKLRHLVFRL